MHEWSDLSSRAPQHARKMRLRVILLVSCTRIHPTRQWLVGKQRSKFLALSRHTGRLRASCHVQSTTHWTKPDGSIGDQLLPARPHSEEALLSSTGSFRGPDSDMYTGDMFAPRTPLVSPGAQPEVSRRSVRSRHARKNMFRGALWNCYSHDNKPRWKNVRIVVCLEIAAWHCVAMVGRSRSISRHRNYSTSV
jgi:hypothetical protein